MENCKVNLTLELPEEDLKDILFKVAADDTTLSELLGGFISDLVCGARQRSNIEFITRSLIFSTI